MLSLPAASILGRGQDTSGREPRSLRQPGDLMQPFAGVQGGLSRKSVPNAEHDAAASKSQMKQNPSFTVHDDELGDIHQAQARAAAAHEDRDGSAVVSHRSSAASSSLSDEMDVLQALQRSRQASLSEAQERSSASASDSALHRRQSDASDSAEARLPARQMQTTIEEREEIAVVSNLSSLGSSSGEGIEEIGMEPDCAAGGMSQGFQTSQQAFLSRPQQLASFSVRDGELSAGGSAQASYDVHQAPARAAAAHEDRDGSAVVSHRSSAASSSLSDEMDVLQVLQRSRQASLSEAQERSSASASDSALHRRQSDASDSAEARLPARQMQTTVEEREEIAVVSNLSSLGSSSGEGIEEIGMEPDCAAGGMSQGFQTSQQASNSRPQQLPSFSVRDGELGAVGSASSTQQTNDVHQAPARPAAAHEDRDGSAVVSHRSSAASSSLSDEMDVLQVLQRSRQASLSEAQERSSASASDSALHRRQSDASDSAEARLPARQMQTTVEEREEIAVVSNLSSLGSSSGEGIEEIGMEPDCAAGGMSQGFQTSQQASNSRPQQLPSFSVRDGELSAGGSAQASYDVHQAPARAAAAHEDRDGSAVVSHRSSAASSSLSDEMDVLQILQRSRQASLSEAQERSSASASDSALHRRQSDASDSAEARLPARQMQTTVEEREEIAVVSNLSSLGSSSGEGIEEIGMEPDCAAGGTSQGFQTSQQAFLSRPQQLPSFSVRDGELGAVGSASSTQQTKGAAAHEDRDGSAVVSHRSSAASSSLREESAKLLPAAGQLFVAGPAAEGHVESAAGPESGSIPVMPKGTNFQSGEQALRVRSCSHGSSRASSAEIQTLSPGAEAEHPDLCLQLANIFDLTERVAIIAAPKEPLRTLCPKLQSHRQFCPQALAE